MLIPYINSLFDTIDDRLNSKEFISNHRLNDTCFLRKRCLDFESLFWCISAHSKKSLQVECSKINEKFENVIPTFSPQAFSKARDKIKSSAFYELFKVSVDCFNNNVNSAKTYKGFRVIAADGTKLQIPDTKENREQFGTAGNKNGVVSMSAASILYDVLNDLILDAEITGVNSAERANLIKMITRTNVTSSDQPKLIILDRGYPSRKLYHFLEDNNYKYIMRSSMSYNTPKAVRNANESDSVVTDVKDKTLKQRVIKITLPSGEVETLITNLFDHSLTLEDFSYLYQLRWPVETKYNEIKHKYKVEKFTGLKKNSIEQDFYITVLLANITSIIKKEADELIALELKKKQTKLSYQCNRNTLIQLFMKVLPKLFLYRFNRLKIIADFVDLIKTKRSAIREDRSAKRKVKHTLQNYRLNQK